MESPTARVRVVEGTLDASGLRFAIVDFDPCEVGNAPYLVQGERHDGEPTLRC